MRSLKPFLLLFSIFFLSVFLSADINQGNLTGAPVEAREEVKLLLNEDLLELDVPPFIENGRTMVPVRAAFEALGAEVSWEAAQQKVFISRNELELELVIGEPFVVIGESRQALDRPPRVVDGRTVVPLRVLAENLGIDVVWDAEKRAVRLFTEEVSAKDGDDGPRDEVELYYEDVEVNIETGGINLGDSSQTLLQKAGKPTRIDSTVYNYEWWVYSDEPVQHIQAGVSEGKVVSIYAVGKEWSFGGLAQGSSKRELMDDFSTVDRLETEGGKSFQLLYPSLIYENMVVTFYIDVLENSITAIRLEDIDIGRARHLDFYKYIYSGGPGKYMEKQRLEEADRAQEKQIFDLVNATRAKRGLPLLEWSDKAAEASRKHSQEMYDHDYFSHHSPLTGKDLAGRLDEEGVYFTLAGENLARGQQDAIEAHHELMNSPGHRESILQENFSYLGTGVYMDCYTQKFFAID